MREVYNLPDRQDEEGIKLVEDSSKAIVQSREIPDATCRKCLGSGMMDEHDYEMGNCDHCGGSGKRKMVPSDESAFEQAWKSAPPLARLTLQAVL